MVGKEKYFRVLGIHPTTDQNLIKKAYRKQALKYHPDINDSADAHIMFIRITEAYEVLSDQKIISNSSATTHRPKTKEEIFAEKVAEAKERWRYQQAQEDRKDKEYFKKVAFGWKWKVFQVFAAYTAVFSILLACDYFLDGRQESCLISDKNVILDPFADILSIKGEDFIVDNYEFWH